jgi:nitrogen fixation protein FixH
MIMPQPSDGFRLTGRHVLFAFIAFFAVVIAVDIVFVRLAVQSFPGEQVEKSYYQGLQYNDVLDAKEQQSQTGWRMQLLTTPEVGQEANFEVRLVDREGAPVYGAEIVGEIVRPTTQTGRQTFAFYPRRNGVYRASLSEIDRGAWDFSVTATKPQLDETAFNARSRIIIE